LRRGKYFIAFEKKGGEWGKEENQPPFLDPEGATRCQNAQWVDEKTKREYSCGKTILT